MVVAEVTSALFRIRLRKRTNGMLHLQKKVQHGDDLGARMQRLFKKFFA
jgi:hypothetical protein